VDVPSATPSTTAFGAAVCANHPRREAIGICVACRKQVCGECTTKVDGINYCVSCLAKLAGPDRREQASAAEASPIGGALWLALGTITLTILAWGLLELGAAW